jgi:glycosyltransferase involved in cell wall biosynthesis
MEHAAKVEILLSTYNGSKHLDEQLTSLVNQTYQNFVVTIRDDDSKDNTREVISKFVHNYPGKFRLIDDGKGNLGSTLSFSTLLELSVENYVMLCDQDDFWLNDKIEVTYNAMRDLEKVYPGIPLMIFTDLTEVDETLNVINKSFFKSQKLFPEICNDPLKLVALNVVAGCTTMINKTALQYVLPLPSSKIIHDQWLAINIAHYGKISFIPTSTLLYRQHAQNVVGANSVSHWYFLKKIFNFKKQINIYVDLITNLKFKVSILGFIRYKILFTVKRLVY